MVGYEKDILDICNQEKLFMLATSIIHFTAIFWNIMRGSEMVRIGSPILVIQTLQAHPKTMVW